MKEDQTQLINARLEHLRFMMESGHMPVFRHRSDMFLFALEAHNIARGLSSRYYRLQEDLDIRFFVRFRFDYWLSRLQQWIEQLGGAEYRVDDDNFFAEGRAKRLTIVVDRLFGYHTDKIPADSKEGSMPLPDDEILPPFRAILDMKSTALVTSFRDALREVHTYLLRLAKSPVSWPVEKRRKAMQLYLDDARQTAKVQGELSEYEYFCAMPDSRSVRGQFCYLKQRLLALAGNGELAQLKLARSEQQALLQQLHSHFSLEETNPTDDQMPTDVELMAGDELFAKFLYLVSLDGEPRFPLLDEDRTATYLIRKDVFLTEQQEQNLQSLFVLMGAIADWIPGADYWDGDEGFHVIFGLAPRIALASFIAFILGSFTNAYVMSRMKLTSNGKNFSARAVLSTVFGEGVDSIIFFPLALGGVIPWEEMPSLMISQVTLKTLYEIVVLPVTIRVVEFTKRHDHEDVYDRDINYNIFNILKL